MKPSPPTTTTLSRAGAIMLLLCQAQVSADEDHTRARELMEAGTILPLEQVYESVKDGRNWRLLEAELEQEGGNWVYEFELLDEAGRVLEIEVDATSGKLLDQKGEE